MAAALRNQEQDMESFKIEHFSRDNPGKSFPKYRLLTTSETDQIHDKLTTILKLENSAEPKKMIAMINDISLELRGVDANDDKFVLMKVFSNLNIQSKEYVYINWYQYDEIDEIDLNDFSKYFNYIWYPSSDDIDIFDSTLSWILCVSHYGNVRFARLSR